MLQALDVFLDLYAFLLGQLAKLIRRDYLAVLHRRQPQPHGRAHKCDLALARALLELAEGRLLALLELLVDGLVAGPVLVALEDRRNGRLQLLDEALHVTLQLVGHARRQLDRVRPVAVLEVVDVTPVVGNRLPGRAVVDEATHRRVLADRIGTDGEQVVAFAADTDAELDRLDRARLADHVAQVLEIGRRLESQLIGIAALLERRGGERRYGHFVLPCWPIRPCVPACPPRWHPCRRR